MTNISLNVSFCHSSLEYANGLYLACSGVICLEVKTRSNSTRVLLSSASTREIKQLFNIAISVQLDYHSSSLISCNCQLPVVTETFTELSFHYSSGMCDRFISKSNITDLFFIKTNMYIIQFMLDSIPIWCSPDSPLRCDM